jgi:hypothetical protein
MLYHFFGLQGSGKSVGSVIFAQDKLIHEGKKIYSNFKITFGEYIDIKKFMGFQYNNCVVILDEAYGIADSHIKSKTDEIMSWVILQSRKRDVDVFMVTQNEGDLYKRIRGSAHKKVLCKNFGTKELPILNYTIYDVTDNNISIIEFDNEILREVYPLFNTKEIIMPLYLNTGCTFENVEETFKDSTTKKTFITLLTKENGYLTDDIASAIFDLMKDENYDRVKKLLKNSG